jgi:ABC-type antimicrobial peptide transport system permease subunit
MIGRQRTVATVTTLSIGATCAAALMGFWETLISWPAAAIAFSFSITMGIIFGIYPAPRASRLEPIRALKSE